MRIENVRVLRDGRFADEPIYIEGERIAEWADGPAEDGGGLLAIPGLVDIHFHGCAGYDLCDGTGQAIQAMADYQASAGVLAICPATMTCPEQKLRRVAQAAAAHKNIRGADLVGLTMEGPFISPQRVGAQNPQYVRRPDAGMFLRLQQAAGGLFRLCCLAPELPGAQDFIRAVRGSVASVSVAHTCAGYDTAMAAFAAGADHLTHCWNAMPGIHHREPGPILAAADAGADVELICDNVHIHPAAVRATFRLFGPEHVVMVSDSTMACGLPDGSYRLGGQAITVVGRRAALAGQPDTIAGSNSNLMDCLRYAVREMDIPLEDAVRAASENPARCIGAGADYGSLAPGRYANIVLLNEQLEPVKIFRHGRPLDRRDPFLRRPLQAAAPCGKIKDDKT